MKTTTLVRALGALAPVALALAVLAPAAPAQLTTVQLPAAADNTLYDAPLGDLSNGAGQHLFAGLTLIQLRRRALVRFDLEALPPGAQIVSAELVLHVSKLSMPLAPEPVRVHRALASWGEGGSDALLEEGSGAPATSGDATWLHRSAPGSFWASPGGDYVAAPSAMLAVDTLGPARWTSLGLANDVQTWVDAPDQNHGWVLVGNETAPVNSTRRFDSREHPQPARRPGLVVTYTLNAGPSVPNPPPPGPPPGPPTTPNVGPFLGLLLALLELLLRIFFPGAG